MGDILINFMVLSYLGVITMCLWDIRKDLHYMKKTIQRKEEGKL